MGLSLCMIVKNEEDRLDRCLEKASGLADEIIIVDTGSKDKTKQIALKYTDKVYDFPWCNDFAKARNYSIDKATKDWILVLDADEEVISYDLNQLKKFMQNHQKTIGRVKRINPFEDGKEIKRYIERVNRLFNKNFFLYEGIIHEQIVAKDGHPYTTEPINVSIFHEGYLDETIATTNKLDRNIQLLIQAINESPQDPYLHYQLGKSYYKQKAFQLSAESFEMAINYMEAENLEYIQDLVESYGYALLKCERYAEALKLKSYNNYYVNLPDFNFLMGLIYMNNALFSEAVKAFEKCIIDHEGKLEGITTYLPNYNIGVIYELLGQDERALEYYQKAKTYHLAIGRFNTTLERCKQTIETLIENGNIQEAFIKLEKILLSYEDAELYSMMGIVKIVEKDYEKAKVYLLKGLALDQNNEDLLYNLEYIDGMKF